MTILLKLVDELFEMYRERLTGDEEDLDIITFTVLEHYNRQELLGIVKEMNDDELHYFISLYLNKSLKGKFAQLEDHDPTDTNFGRHLH